MNCYKCRIPIEVGQPRQHGLHEACFRSWFKLPSPEDFTNIIVRTPGSRNPPEPGLSNQRINSSAFHGTYKKYSATLGKETYILKVQEPNFPELPGTEYLSNQIAESLGLQVADFYLLNFRETLLTFVSRNFITDYSPANLIHIYHYLKKDTEFSCENIVKILEDQTEKFSEIERFVELCLFDALIGNHDRHGRNLAIVETSANRKILSPFYDNPSYLGIEVENMLGAQLEPRGKISTLKTTEPALGDYAEEFKRLGFEATVTQFSKRISLLEIEKLIAEAYISDKRKQGFRTLVSRRFEELTRAA